MALERLQHSGDAIPTTITTTVSSSSTSMQLTAATGWPDGSVGPFYAVLDAGTASEEKVLFSARSSTTLTVASGGRGADNTTATGHTGGSATIKHCLAAAEVDDDNAHVYTTSRDDHTQYARTDGTREITGAQTFGNNVTVDGNLSAAGTLAATGNATLGGTLGVTGAATLASTLHAQATTVSSLTVTGAVSTGGLITAGGLQALVVSGVGTPIVGSYTSQQIRVQAGSASGTTNSNFELSVSFEEAFPNGVFAVIPVGYGTSPTGGDGIASVTTSGFVWAGPLQNTPSTLMYIAIGF